LSEVSTIKTALLKEIDIARDKLELLGAFEEKHRAFLLNSESGYFLNDGDYAIVFFYDSLDEVKDYFGADGWRLASHTGAVERTVDGVVVRLILPHDNGFANQELTI
jgi:hypothetical protein